MQSPKLRLFLGVLLSVALVIGLFTGCSAGGGKQASVDTDKDVEDKGPQETGKGEKEYPLSRLRSVIGQPPVRIAMMWIRKIWKFISWSKRKQM